MGTEARSVFSKNNQQVKVFQSYNVQPMLEHSTKNLVKYLGYKYRKMRAIHWKLQQLRFARVTFNISYEK